LPTLMESPTRIQAAGTPPKIIEEIVGRVNTAHEQMSVARMRSPEGWREPGQRPEFLEISVVLAGRLRVEFEGGRLEVREGQAIMTHPGEWVRYSTPEEGGAEYISICLPAFSPEMAHRDPEPD